jgi:hypothetical protein
MNECSAFTVGWKVSSGGILETLDDGLIRVSFVYQDAENISPFYPIHYIQQSRSEESGIEWSHSSYYQKIGP